MLGQLKHTVSKSKRRLIDEKNNIDLDLSYINDRVIAMGFPSEGSESVYRNPMSEVQRFLEMKHKDHYRVYNLCSERSYDIKKFHHRVARFPFDDHNCPIFEDIFDFCEDVKNWIDEHPDNIAVVHCKAGKGRTGLMICCWLIFNREWDTADDALKFYAAARTHNQKGVTIPSQVRYIHYFEQRLREGASNRGTFFLTEVVFHGQPKNVQELRYFISKAIRSNPDKDRSIHNVLLIQGRKKVRELVKEAKDREKGKAKTDGSNGAGCGEDLCQLVLAMNPYLPLCGDIKFEFEKLLHFWINTEFIRDNRVILTKPEMDKAHKDLKDKIYPSNFRVELRFKEPSEVTMAEMEPAEPSPSGDQDTAAGSSSSSSSSSSSTTESERGRIERPNGVSLQPESYKRLMLNYPSLQPL